MLFLFQVMVIGISRETDIVRIESIKYISSEFDRICKTHSFNNEKELAKRLLSVTKTVVNANISSGDSIFINVREKKAIRTGKIKAYKYFEWWKCAKGRNIWQRKKKIMDKFYNEDVELCNKRLQQLKSIHRARTISFPNFRKKFGQRKDITQKSNQLLKQAINLANQEEKKYKKVSKIRDDLHLKREYVLNINENLYKVFEACRHENRTLHIVYRKLFNQYKKSVNIQINKTKEIENLNTELDEQKKKKETQIQLWYEADSQHEKSMKEEEERSERINKEMKEIATNILHLETEIIKKRSQLLDTTERLKSEENELEKIKDFGIELDVIEQEMNKTRDEIYANKKILQHWDDKLKKSAQNMDARQRQCANRRRRLPESEEKLSKETDKYIKLENIRSNLEDELKICQLNRIEKLEELKSSKKEMEKIREDYESNFAAITRKLEIEKHEIEEQSKEALRSLEKIEKETSQTVKNTERIQRELNSIIDMTRSLQKINKDIDTSLDKCQDAERKCHGELQNHDKKKETLLKKIEQIKKEGKDEEKNQVQQKILSEIEEKEKERFEIRVSQCKQRLQSLKERQEEEPNLRMDRKMYFWFALITILVVTAMLIFTVVFYLSQKSHTQS